MARKDKTAPAPTTASIAQIESGIAALLKEIDTERRSLRQLILAGDNTAPTRARIAALEAKLADAKARISDLIERRDAQLADDVARDTADIAGRLVTAIAARLAALEPPAQPSK